MTSRFAADFGPSVFVCSKPLQALHCASIVRAFEIDDARLHVVTRVLDDHEAFREFFESTSHRRLFQSVSWHATYEDAITEFAGNGYESLFVEDDRVSFYHLFAPLRTERMVLFEEGLGTYRGQYATTMPAPKRMKWKFKALTTGCGFEFGGGRKTDLVMVYSPETYRRTQPRLGHKAVGFPGLIDEIQRDRHRWESAVRATVDLESVPDHCLALVLGTWGGASDEVIDRVSPEAEKLYYKPHPHDGCLALGGRAVAIESSWIPAEVYIDLLARLSRKLLVYHFSSSAAFYTGGLFPNVEFVDLLSAPQFVDLLAQ